MNFQKNQGKDVKLIDIDLEKMSEKLRALIELLWPYGNIYAYQGGAQKTITGTVV